MRELFLIEETRTVIRYADVGISQLRETLVKSDGLFWLDIEQISDEDIDLLKAFKEFSFHALSVEECRTAAGRPQICEFPNYLFLVLYTLDARDQSDAAGMAKLCVFLTPDYLVTVHATPLPFLQDVKDRIEEDYMMMRSPSFCLAMILEAMADHLDPGIAHLDGEITAMGNLLEDMAAWETLHEINRAKRHVLTMHQTFRPQSEMLHELITQTYPQMQAETVIQIRNAYQRFVGIVERLTRYREALVDLRDGYLIHISTRSYTAVNRLTRLAAVFLPLICLAALFGINEQLVPGMNPLFDFLAVALFLTVVAGGIAIWSKRE